MKIDRTDFRIYRTYQESIHCRTLAVAARAAAAAAAAPTAIAASTRCPSRSEFPPDPILPLKVAFYSPFNMDFMLGRKMKKMKTKIKISCSSLGIITAEPRPADGSARAAAPPAAAATAAAAAKQPASSDPPGADPKDPAPSKPPPPPPGQPPSN